MRLRQHPAARAAPRQVHPAEAHLARLHIHAGAAVVVLARDLDVRTLTTAGEALRDLTLNPDRDH